VRSSVVDFIPRAGPRYGLTPNCNPRLAARTCAPGGFLLGAAKRHGPWPDPGPRLTHRTGVNSAIAREVAGGVRQIACVASLRQRYSRPGASGGTAGVDGGGNPRKSGDGQKVGTKIAVAAGQPVSPSARREQAPRDDGADRHGHPQSRVCQWAAPARLTRPCRPPPGALALPVCLQPGAPDRVLGHRQGGPSP
jgi:hypothetical protein